MKARIVLIGKERICNLCNQPIRKMTEAWFMKGNDSTYWHLDCVTNTKYPALSLIDNLTLKWFKSCHQNWKFI